MATVHEEMHQRTGQYQQEWQCAYDMRPMLFQQEIGCNRSNHE